MTKIRLYPEFIRKIILTFAGEKNKAMMNAYRINTILNTTTPTSLHVGIFEDTPDPEGIEWAHRHSY